MVGRRGKGVNLVKPRIFSLGLATFDLADLSDRPASQSLCSIDSRSVSKLEKALNALSRKRLHELILRDHRSKDHRNISNQATRVLEQAVGHIFRVLRDLAQKVENERQVLLECADLARLRV